MLIDNYFPSDSRVPAVLDDVTCSGDEPNLGYCELGVTSSADACAPHDYVAIRCMPAGEIPLCVYQTLNAAFRPCS